MLLHSIEIHNYKSIGETNNIIIVEPRITTIIGKNESGKSNILEALSKVSFTDPSVAFFNIETMNKQCTAVDKVKVVACLKWKDGEKNYFGNNEETYIEISKNNYIVSGGLKTFFEIKCKPIIDELNEILENNPYKYKNTDWEQFHNKRKMLINETMNIPLILDSLKYFRGCNNICKDEIKNSINLKLDVLDELFLAITTSLPVFHYRNSDKILKGKYTIDELKTKATATDLIDEFLKVIDCEKTELINSISQGTSDLNITRRGNIKKSINRNINNPFKQYYEPEKLSLGIEYGSNNVTFTVEAEEGTVVSLSERSNGLKWYLNHFIDVQANKLKEKNVIYLLDEPGVFLHINAQRKLLELFEDLADKGNQIIYTTHLPSMIETDKNGLHRIRSVEKNKDEYTLIFKTAHDRNISEENYQDTIAPVIKAIGMDMTYSLLPAADKLNVVVEGSSDYIFLKCLVKKLEIDLSAYNLIPARGVNNVVNVCSILTGWGCPNIAIFDYDYEGVIKGAQEMDMLSTDNHIKYLFIKDITTEEMQNRTYNESPYMIEDFIGRDFIYKFIEENHNLTPKSSKTLVAKLLCNDIEEGIIDFPQAAKDNTINLFERLKNIIE